MSKLNSELQRLFVLPGQEFETPVFEAPQRLELVSLEGKVRTLVISIFRGRDWEAVSALYQGVQADLELPAPAISVSADEGYQIWFSLAEPVSLSQADRFLNGLRSRYLGALPVSAYTLRPSPENAEKGLIMVPALHGVSEKWSAFIDPQMVEMFGEELGLDMAPGSDRQAEMLAGVRSIKSTDFQRALATLLTAEPVKNAASSEVTALEHQPPQDSHFVHPQAFLMKVMNDGSLAMADRIAAAQALLPYFAQHSGTRESDR